MNPAGKYSTAVVLSLTACIASSAHAADYLDLPVVRPSISCEQLAKAELGKVEGAAVTIKSTAVMETPKGPFCMVMGNIEPTVGFEVYLPMERWTQRYAQGPQGSFTIGRAGANKPAINGELVLAANDKGGPGNARDTSWTYDNQQKRIDWAYRANHVTALAAKALIKTFYGQLERFSYFVGCSAGGKETLIEAQRYPDDFDGIVAGAPVVIDNVHNAFYPGWEWEVNRRSDGSVILASNKLGILHDAVIKQCTAKSGVLDGVLQHANACKFEPAWMQCKAGAPDTSQCLTSEEAGVAQKLYEGPRDSAGRQLDISGFPMGSELMWKLSTTGNPANEATNPGRSLIRMLASTDPGETAATIDKKFAYNQEWFNKAVEVGPLWNSANTNLRPFQKSGGKLILWVGGSDLTLQPSSTITYYEGVQKELGVKQTDTFTRFFLLPGVGHCGGGDGPDQVDVLSPLMAWTELNQTPAMLIVGKISGRAAGGNGKPFSAPAEPTVFTRPVFPYPNVAQYAGMGDPKDAVNYRSIKPAMKVPQVFAPEITRLIGADNQKFYRVENGKLVAEKTK